MNKGLQFFLYLLPFTLMVLYGFIFGFNHITGFITACTGAVGWATFMTLEAIK